MTLLLPPGALLQAGPCCRDQPAKGHQEESRDQYATGHHGERRGAVCNRVAGRKNRGQFATGHQDRDSAPLNQWKIRPFLMPFWCLMKKKEEGEVCNRAPGRRYRHQFATGHHGEGKVLFLEGVYSWDTGNKERLNLIEVYLNDPPISTIIVTVQRKTIWSP